MKVNLAKILIVKSPKTVAGFTYTTSNLQKLGLISFLKVPSIAKNPGVKSGKNL